MYNPIIDSFLKNEENKKLYQEYLSNPQDELKGIIEKNFEFHYRKFQILSYFSKTLHFEAQRFDKKNRGYQEKHSLVLDQEDSLDDHLYFQNLDLEQSAEQYDFMHKKVQQLSEIVTDEKLHAIIQNLKQKNKDLLYLLYVEEIDEKEVANKLGISVQAVNKRKNQLLKKINQQYVKE